MTQIDDAARRARLRHAGASDLGALADRAHRRRRASARARERLAAGGVRYLCAVPPGAGALIGIGDFQGTLPVYRVAR